MTNQFIFKASCWTCKRAREDPNEEYVCPKVAEHWQEMEKYEFAH
jgi:hypothetical protein